jgi:hypothetical protein
MKRLLIAALVALFVLGNGGLVASASHEEDEVFAGVIRGVGLNDDDEIDWFFLEVEDDDGTFGYLVDVDDDTDVDRNGVDVDDLNGKTVEVIGEIDDDNGALLHAFSVDVLNEDEVQKVLRGKVVFADLDDIEGEEVLDSLRLEVRQDGETKTYQVEVFDETDLDLNDVDLDELVGERAVVAGELDEDDSGVLLADRVTILDQDDVEDDENDEEVDDGHRGGGMSAAAHYKNEHVNKGPAQGIFMRCVHDGELSFEECATIANAASPGDHGNGNGHGNGHGKNKNKHKP